MSASFVARANHPSDAMTTRSLQHGAESASAGDSSAATTTRLLQDGAQTVDEEENRAPAVSSGASSQQADRTTRSGRVVKAPRLDDDAGAAQPKQGPKKGAKAGRGKGRKQ